MARDKTTKTRTHRITLPQRTGVMTIREEETRFVVSLLWTKYGR